MAPGPSTTFHSARDDPRLGRTSTKPIFLRRFATRRRISAQMRCALLPLICLLAFATGFAADLPNIVLIFTDDQGYADLGCFGAKGFTTPNIDRLAREGRRFTDFHTAAPVCSASRVALLTGCYPPRLSIHGALPPKSKIALHPDEMT